LCHPWPQQRQQQRSSRNNNNAIFGIDNLILGLTQTQLSTNDEGKRMGRMEANDSDGRQRQLMWEKMDTTTVTAEQQVPSPPPATINQHKERWWLASRG